MKISGDKRKKFKNIFIDPKKVFCEHFTEIKLASLQKFNLNSFGKCRICRNESIPGYGLNFSICLTCGYQGCMRPQDRINHVRNHFQANPDHPLVLSLLNFKICCLICDDFFDTSGIDLGKFLRKAHDYHIKEIALRNLRGIQPVKPCGIQNVGWSCYANAVVQCLYACEEFRKTILKVEYKLRTLIIPSNHELNPLNIFVACPLGPLGRNLCRVFKLFTDPSFKDISPLAFMEVSRRRLHAFEEFIMHDAQEFLLAILNNVSSEIKEHVHEIIKNNITSTSENMATYKRTIPEFFIETLFQGKLLSEVVCNECQNKTCTVDTFVDLSLPIKKKKKKTSKFLGLIHIKKNKSPQKTSKVVIQLNGVQIYSQSLAKKPLFSSNFFKIKNQKNERSRSRSISYIPLIKTNSHEQIQCMSENIDIFQFYQQQNGKCISESKSMNADSSRCVIQIGQFYNIYYTATKTPQVEIIEAVPKIEVPATKEQLRNIQNLYKMKERRKSRCSSWPKVVNTMLNFDTSHLRRAISLNLHQNINQTRNIDLSSSNIGDSAYMFFSQPQNPEFDSQAEPDSHSNTFHDVPENSLYSCLNNFFATETFENSNEIYCQNCTEKFKTKIYSKASKKFRILKLPRHLIIHLKRFKQIDDNIIKVHDHIKFPETLNLKQYCRLRGTSSVYSLFAVIEHIGGLQIGHYIAYVRFSTAGKRWYIVNDGCVKEVPIDDVLKANAYILFYDAKI